ncbi:Sister chromatid cohesion protein PDS5-like B [Porphyridium purpureum]|uniref:Sister chromatid cohesion protein PDS5-like B n=1 Tax=Porphyridium purpureum TaxID=35688 RepID=A0A5J4Z310_PORPP|nr:Sister chromatid cohesion protein PDS5-like B [Porphyridium purpureum]|eukprot:POR0648..scf208_2
MARGATRTRGAPAGDARSARVARGGDAQMTLDAALSTRVTRAKRAAAHNSAPPQDGAEEQETAQHARPCAVHAADSRVEQPVREASEEVHHGVLLDSNATKRKESPSPPSSPPKRQKGKAPRRSEAVPELSKGHAPFSSTPEAHRAAGGAGPSQRDAAELVPLDLTESCDASEKILRLRAAHQALCRVSQGSSDASVRRAARAVGSEALIKHPENEVRLLTACCLAEILRIFAPDAPYSKRSEHNIFELFVRQLAHLENTASPFFKTYCDLLAKLAALRVFVLVMDTEDIICSLVRCMYQAASADHSYKIFTNMGELLSSFIVELSGSLSETVLEALLAPLAEFAASGDQLKSPALKLALHVFEKHETLLVAPVSSFLKSVLDGSAVDSELVDGLDAVLAGLVSVSTGYLTELVPELERDLHVQDVDMRTQTINRIGALLTMKEANVAEACPRLFHSFLKHFLDPDPAIRRKMLSFGLLQSAASLPAAMIDELKAAITKRLYDADASVRLEAVTAVFKAARKMEHVLESDVATRIADRRPEIRAETVRQFIELFIRSNKDLYAPFARLDDAHDKEQVPQVPQESNKSAVDDFASYLESMASSTMHVKFAWVPSALLLRVSVLSSDDPAAVASISNALCSGFVDTGRSVSTSQLGVPQRLGNFAIILSLLSDDALQVLEKLLRSRANAIGLARKFVQARQDMRGKAQDLSAASTTNATSALGKAIQRLAHCFPECVKISTSGAGGTGAAVSRKGASGRESQRENAAAEQYLRQLASVKDMRVFARLGEFLESSLSSERAAAVTKDLIERLGGVDTDVGRFVGECLVPKLIPGCFTCDHVELALRALTSKLEGTGPKETRRKQGREVLLPDRAWDTLPRFLTLAAIQFPTSFGGGNVSASFEHFLDLVVSHGRKDSADDVQGLQRLLIQILSSCGGELSLKPSFSTRLRDFALSLMQSSEEWSKTAARALANLIGDDQKLNIWTSLIGGLVERAMPNLYDPHADTSTPPIIALCEIAKQAPLAFREHCSWDLFSRFMEIMQSEPEEGWNPWLVAPPSVSASESVQKTNKDGKRIDNGKAEEDRAFVLWRPNTVRVVMKFLVRFVTCHARDLFEREKLDKSHPDAQDIRTHASKLVFCLCSVLEQDGDVCRIFPGAENEEARLDDDSLADIRLTAAHCVLRVMYVRSLQNVISPHGALRVMLVAQDASARVRTTFARKVYRGILRKNLPTYMMCSFVFMAVEPDRDAYELARAFGVDVVRKVSESVRRACARSSDQQRHLELEPENVLKYLVWFIAHHPDFEQEEEMSDLAHAREPRAFLSMFFDMVLDKRDLAAYLVQILQSVFMYRDAMDRRSVVPQQQQHTAVLHSIAALGLDILKEKCSGRKWDLTEYKGRVAFPHPMYRDRNAEMGTTAMDSSAMSPRGTGTSQQHAQWYGDGKSTKDVFLSAARRLHGQNASQRQPSRAPLGTVTSDQVSVRRRLVDEGGRTVLTADNAAFTGTESGHVPVSSSGAELFKEKTSSGASQERDRKRREVSAWPPIVRTTSEGDIFDALSPPKKRKTEAFVATDADKENGDCTSPAALTATATVSSARQPASRGNTSATTSGYVRRSQRLSK